MCHLKINKIFWTYIEIVFLIVKLFTFFVLYMGCMANINTHLFYGNKKPTSGCNL